jgi:hypothetical protein
MSSLRRDRLTFLTADELAVVEALRQIQSEAPLVGASLETFLWQLQQHPVEAVEVVRHFLALSGAIVPPASGEVRRDTPAAGAPSPPKSTRAPGFLDAH